MKKYHYQHIKIIFLLLFFFSQMGCDIGEMEITETPGSISKEEAINNLDKVFNDLEAEFISSIFSFSNLCMPIMRMRPLKAKYEDVAIGTQTSLDYWRSVYLNLIPDADLIINEAAKKELNYYVGIAKTLKAYMLINMVDTFGDIICTEANRAPKIKEAKLDKGKEVYQFALTMLKEAEMLFASDKAGQLPEDLFYDSDPKKWIKLIHTIRLKVYLQMRLIDPDTSRSEINKIIAKGNYIQKPEDDFQYPFTKHDVNPDSRHPYYFSYEGNEGFSGFASNYLIYILKDQKKAPKTTVTKGSALQTSVTSLPDPRLRYYLYRQSSQKPEKSDLLCEVQGQFKPGYYCYLGNGYRGYDHGDKSPPSSKSLEQTGWGIYPVAGAFDEDSFTSIDKNKGAGGDGIEPILLSSWVNFMLAESALTLHTTGDAQTYFETGIRQSIEKVQAFGAARGVDLEALKKKKITLTSLEDYLAAAREEYKAKPLDAVIKEYYIAAYGNGIEPYNNYRRTGYPSDLQNPVEYIGNFPRSFAYPIDVTRVNKNIDQKKITDPVFWDTGKTQLF